MYLPSSLSTAARNPLPYKVVETLRRITNNLQPVRHVHAIHQNRLAHSIHTLLAARTEPKLLSVIVDCRCWDLYADGPPTNPNWWYPPAENLLPWLDNHDARQKIRAVFVEYEHTLSLSNELPDTLPRLRKILRRLDSLHAEDMVRPTATERAGFAAEDIEGSGSVQVEKPSPAPNIQNPASDVGGKEARVV
ncbi:hypothetical protein FB451DRAFT_1188901 [Mycena latifolia]|nr:hypothetical protein FB451DRAFT_1188901 [Mycena latifolia]